MGEGVHLEVAVRATGAALLAYAHEPCRETRDAFLAAVRDLVISDAETKAGRKARIDMSRPIREALRDDPEPGRGTLQPGDRRAA